MHVFVSMIIENAKVIAPQIQYITTIDVKGIWGFFFTNFLLVCVIERRQFFLSELHVKI